MKPERIPYCNWINSQLSIARHYGAIKINETTYHVDYITHDLVRDDVWKKDKKSRAASEKAKWEKVKSRQVKIDIPSNDNPF